MALAVMLSWALLADTLWNFLVDKPPHHDKVSSIEGELFGYKYRRMEHMNRNRDFHLMEHLICVKLYVKVNIGLFFGF